VFEQKKVQEQLLREKINENVGRRIMKIMHKRDKQLKDKRSRYRPKTDKDY
jgi:hypothetical protein